MDVVGTLQRSPDGDTIACVVLGNHAVVLNIEVFPRTGAVFALNNVVGAGPHLIHISFFKKKALKDIVLAPHDYVLPFAFFDGEHGGKRFVFDMDGRDSLPQLLLVAMRDQHDGLFAMVYIPVGKTRLIRKDQLDVILAGNIGCGYDRKLIPIDLGVERDRPDQSPGDGASDGSAVPHPFAIDVIDVTRATGQLIHALLSGDGGADDAGFRARAHVRKCQPSRTD